MSIKQKVTASLNVQAAESFVEAIQTENYYVFASRHTPFSIAADGATDDNPPTPADTTLNALTLYDQMLFGKKVLTEQTTTMIKRYNWVANTAYAMYDDADINLDTKQFYVVTDVGTDLNVYKCLNNNNGARSTQKPSDVDTSPIEYLDDGYVWKYMYTIDDFSARKFATTEFVPVIPNNDVTAAAIPGAIEVIAIDDGGAGYRNFTIGSFPDETAINIQGSQLKYGLGINASEINSYYNNCLIKITSGPARGEYRLITDYTITGGRRVITLNRPFITIPRATDSYEIYPNVHIQDISGTSTANCVARAIINANSGYSVSKIEVLSGGENYRITTADIRTSNIVAVTTAASIIPVISPPGGHGSNINNELRARYVGIASSFTGNTSPLIAQNDFRTVGILRGPQFANVSVIVDTTTVVGSFISGERVLRYKPILISNNVELFANSLIVGTGTAFIDSLRVNDRLIITNGLTNLYANIELINGQTELVIDKENPSLVAANCSLYYIEGVPFATVLNYDVGRVSMTDVDPTDLNINSFILGETSSATAKISNTMPNVFIGSRAADEFNTFSQLTTLVGAINSTIGFIEDETIVQERGNTTATAIVHSFRNNAGVANDFLYITTVSNNMSNGTVVGMTSNAVLTVLDKYNGDIVRDSGEILYLENTNPIARNPRQTENIRIILEF